MKGERISFGQLKEVMPIPDLIGIQTKSFADFLQKDVAPDKRKNEGLQSVFRDMFPRKADGSRNYSGIEFVEYEVVEGDSDLPELLKSGKNYEASIFAKFRMQGNSQKDIRDERLLLVLPELEPARLHPAQEEVERLIGGDVGEVLVVRPGHELAERAVRERVAPLSSVHRALLPLRRVW